MSDLKLTHKEWSDKLLEKLPKKRYPAVKKGEIIVTDSKGGVKTDVLPRLSNAVRNETIDQVIKAIKELE